MSSAICLNGLACEKKCDEDKTKSSLKARADGLRQSGQEKKSKLHWRPVKLRSILSTLGIHKLSDARRREIAYSRLVCQAVIASVDSIVHHRFLFFLVRCFCFWSQTGYGEEYSA